jgi:hypothetical protein
MDEGEMEDHHFGENSQPLISLIKKKNPKKNFRFPSISEALVYMFYF